MIYALEFDRYFESREHYGDAQSTLMSIYDIYRRKGVKCLLMYKYKLPNLEREWVNPRGLVDKYCFKDPSEINFDKIDCDYVMLYHTSIYNPDNIPDYYTNELRKLFEFCETNNKDLFIPLLGKKLFKNEFTDIVKGILSDFNHQIFQINQIEDQFKFEKVLTRHLKLNDLLK